MTLALTSLGLHAAWSGPQTVTVPLTYKAPEGNGPKPNFSPKGTQVTLTDAPSSLTLPEGATRPAKVGSLQVGPDRASWLPVLATATTAHPKDLVRLYIHHNRNARFGDDGAPMTATPTQNEKTKAWWNSYDAAELKVKFASPARELLFSVSFWIVREDDQPAPNILRYSRRSWVSGTATINGIAAHVAAMDGNNDAMYGPGDSWSVVQASMPNTASAVLSIKEARDTTRFMFLERPGGKDLVLEFKSFARDGSSVTFAVVDKPMTKAEDRLADDGVAAERPRPRATTPLTWSH